MSANGDAPYRPGSTSHPARLDYRVDKSRCGSGDTLRAD